MAVPGKRATNSYSASLTGSDEDLEIYCQPCDLEGDRLPAHGFCTNCKEHLCRTCFKLHKKHKLSRNHILLDKENMPKQLHLTSSSLNSQQDDDFTKPCSRHQKEMIKFYCHVHEELLCSVCVTLQHIATPCKVDYIPDISGAVINSKDYNGILRDLDRISEQYQKLSKETKQTNAISEKSLQDALADIKKFRREINQRLDELEKHTERAAKTLQVEINNTLKTVEINCDDVTKSTKMMSDSIKQLNSSKQGDRLFMELKMAEQMIKNYEVKISQITSFDLKEYNFQPNEYIISILKKETTLGVLSQKIIPQPIATEVDYVTTRQASFQTEICVKIPNDRMKCLITGIAVFTADLVIITDWENNAIKMVNVRNHFITDHVHVDGPIDITSITNTEFVVTLRDKQSIQFISASPNKLDKKHTIKVESECYGITCCQGKLIVTLCNPAQLQILDINGTSLTTIKGENIFTNPIHVTASGDSIYVSDFAKKRITRLNWDGKVVGSYDGLDCPRGITCSENGTIFVCDSNRNIIQEFSPDFSKENVLLKNLNNPKAICWCGVTNNIYIGRKTGDGKYDDFLQIYRLS